jgi:hypothetical protein
MIMTKLVLPEQLQKDIHPLSTALYEYFAEGVRLALPYFMERHLPVSDTLLTFMVRYEVRRQLIANGVPLEDEAETQSTEVEMESLALLGLGGFYNGYDFKIFKSNDGLLPVAVSEPRQKFYDQQLRMRFPPELSTAAPTLVKLNIAILWRFDTSWTNVDLSLAVPKAGGPARRLVSAYYTVPIAHPVTTIIAPVSQVVQTPTDEPVITIKASELETGTQRDDLRKADTAG